VLDEHGETDQERSEAGMSRTLRDAMTRRDFVRTLAGAGALLGLPGGLFAAEEAKPKGKRTAVDKVTLGKTKVVCSRLAMGTGSNGGQVQRDMGAEGFSALVRHGYDRGVRFVDTADDYGMHGLVGKAIRGLPRDTLTIQTKLQWRRDKDVLAELDRFRKEIGTDYLDIVLLHNTDATGWPEKLERQRDALAAAKEKGIIRAHGVSVHGLPGLREVARCKWVDVALLRINHAGRHMDGEKGQWAEPSRFDEATAEIAKIHAAGKAVIAMKLIGNGEFKAAEEREKSIRFVLTRPFVTAVDIGFASPSEIDEAIRRIDGALTA
jgi:aryl-alcohol dehydrogenase-like predicted oxidoreductase